MNRVKKILWIYGILFLAMAQRLPAQQTPQIQWYSDLDAAKRIAASENKPILIHFAASWCRPCQHLEKFVFNHAQIIREINDSFVAVKLDVDTYPGLAKQFQTDRVPMDVILNPQGQTIQKRSSPDSVDNYLTMLRDGGTVAKQSTQANEQRLIAQRDELQDRWSQAQATQQQQQQQQMPLSGGEFRIPEFAQSTRVAPVQSPNAQATTPPTMPPTTVAQTESPLALPPELPLASPVSPATQVVQSTASPGAKAINQLRTDSNNSDVTAIRQTVANPFANPQVTGRASRGVDDQLFLTHDAAVSPAQSVAVGTHSPAAPSTPTPPASLALAGDCPVSLLVDNQWVAGKPEFSCVHRGKTYLFASAEYQAKFQQDPDNFSPLLGGHDPVVFHEQGQWVDGLKEHGVFMSKDGQQRVVLFRDQQTRQKFRDEPHRYLEAVRMAMENQNVNPIR